MRKHRCPGGVKGARFPGMSGVSDSIFIFVKRMYS